MVSIELLKQMSTISSVKVFVYLYEKSNKHGVFRVSTNQIIDESGIPRNSTRRGLKELVDKDIVKIIAKGKGNHPNTYQVPKNDTPKTDAPKKDHTETGEKTEVNGWKKAVGSRVESEEEPKSDHEDEDSNIINNIIYKDFKEINFLSTDINSLSIFNENLKLNNDQLGKLARRVLVEWFLPMSDLKKQPKYFFPQQMKLLKDLLVEWRTEQVLASIEYWTKVNPPKNGMKSLRWLQFERKKRSHVMVALDHYKQQYLEKQSDLEKEEREEKVEEMKKQALEIAKQNVAEKTKVDETPDDDFVNDLLGSVGKINIGEE